LTRRGGERPDLGYSLVEAEIVLIPGCSGRGHENIYISCAMGGLMRVRSKGDGYISLIEHLKKRRCRVDLVN
jgi:hypothetical protein